MYKKRSKRWFNRLSVFSIPSRVCTENPRLNINIDSDGFRTALFRTRIDAFITTIITIMDLSVTFSRLHYPSPHNPVFRFRRLRTYIYIYIRFFPLLSTCAHRRPQPWDTGDRMYARVGLCLCVHQGFPKGFPLKYQAQNYA
jgi:hypothetical protein